jgi:threonine aldolase
LRAGIDILSYGATKNGGICADGDDRNGPHYRFVTAWNSTAAAIGEFVTAASRQAQLGGAA